jgi:DNA-directed RNA polymerase specialized sigma24 family protein
VSSDEDVASVAAAFARLRDSDRELLALAAWEGLDPGEIAVVLDCSRNAARIRLHRARKRLAREVHAARSSPGGNLRSLISIETERGR